MSLFSLLNQNIRRCPTVWISTNSRIKEKTDYIYLLQKEKALIDNVQDTLQNKAMKLYQKCIVKPESSLAARCCDYKMLEEKCSSYSNT